MSGASVRTYSACKLQRSDALLLAMEGQCSVQHGLLVLCIRTSDSTGFRTLTTCGLVQSGACKWAHKASDVALPVTVHS